MRMLVAILMPSKTWFFVIDTAFPPRWPRAWGSLRRSGLLQLMC